MRPVNHRRLRAVPVALCLFLSACIAQATLDPYGGDTRVRGTVTGFFHPEKVGDRYWLITPDGNGLLSIGSTVIRFRDTWGQSPLALGYRANLLALDARYTDPSGSRTPEEMWIDANHARLDAWGQNSIGCWSQDMSGTGIRKPEAFRDLGITGTHRSRGGRMLTAVYFADVFDEPTFSETADLRASVLAAHASDPWRIGAFPDNELDWSNRPNRTEHLAAAFFDQPGSPGKTHWIEEILKPQYGAIESLNDAWGTSYTSWDGPEPTSFMNETVIPPDDPAHPAIHADKVEMVRAAAEKYFSTVTAAMRKYDPNHIVFSNRIGLFPGTYEPQFEDFNRVVWEAAGKYCDMIVVNCYREPAAFQEQYGYFSKVFEAAGKPILIGEWNRIGNDGIVGPLHGSSMTPNQCVRGRETLRVAREFLSVASRRDPADGGLAYMITGLHWFQYYDEPATGRPDGERWNAGYLDGLDEPYVTVMRPFGDFLHGLYDRIIEGDESTMPDPPAPMLPAEGAVIRTNRPRLEWSAQPDADAFEILLSQANYFPEDQCIILSPVSGTSAEVPDDLAAGRWFWSVRSLRNDGRGGYFSEPASFLVETDPAAADLDSFGFEKLAGWRANGRGDAGGGGSALARQDRTLAADGVGSLRMDFAGFSLNRLTGRWNFQAIESSRFGPDVRPPTGESPALGPLTGLPLAFADDFSDGDDYGWTYRTGAWAVSSGQYRQTQRWNWGSRSGPVGELSDFEIRFDVRIDASDVDTYWAGALLRRATPRDGNSESGYLFGIRRNGGVFLWTHDDKIVAEEASVIEDTSVFHHVAIVGRGPAFSVYIDDELWTTWTDPNNRYPTGHFGLICGRSSATFDNVAVYAEEEIQDAPALHGQTLAVEWDGPDLDYSGVERIEFDVLPFRMARQDGTLVPVSAFLHFRVLDPRGDIVIDQPVDADGSFPVESWSRVSFPFPGDFDGAVGTMAFYVDTGEFLFPLDQRLRVQIDNLTPPSAIGEALRTDPSFAGRDDFDGKRPAGWISRWGVWGIADGRARGFAIRSGPSTLIARADPIRTGVLSATLQTLSTYDSRRAWIVFAHDPETGAFRFAGFDTVADRWEIGRFDGAEAVVEVSAPAELDDETDYDLTLVLDEDAFRLWNGTNPVLDFALGSIPAPDPIITAVARNGYTVEPDLQDGAPAFSSGDATYSDVPEFLQGVCYVRTVSRDSRSLGDEILIFDLAAAGVVYLFHDDGIDPKPSWMNGFADTGETLSVGGDSYRIYSRIYPAGTHPMGGNLYEPWQSGGMYGFAARPLYDRYPAGGFGVGTWAGQIAVDDFRTGGSSPGERRQSLLGTY